MTDHYTSDHVLIAKDLATEQAWVVGVYYEREDAEGVMKELMEEFEERVAYKIEEKSLV